MRNESLGDALMNFLRKKKEDRGAMALLRCALVKSKRYRAWPLLAGFNGIGDSFHSLAVQYIAGFYATHPEESKEDSDNFGATCHKLMDEDERKKVNQEKTGPLSRRFEHLLSAEYEEIFPRVLRFILRAKAQEVRVNYRLLFDDLMRWQLQRDIVRMHWAKGFWIKAEEVDHELGGENQS